MFNKRRKAQIQQIDTLVGKGTRIVGDVHFSGGFHVDGQVHGNVDAAQPGSTLSVSDGGVIEGSVSVPRVVLNGGVTGDIVAEERVELGETARVAGNVYYCLIEMAMGAQINGKLIYQPPAPTQSKGSTDSAVGENSTSKEPLGVGYAGSAH